MRRLRMWAWAAVVIVAVVGAEAGEAPRDWVVRFDGVGPAKIGMTLAELNDALGEKFTMPKDQDAHGCFYVKPSGHGDVMLMIEEGHFSRVDVRAAGVATVSGIQVGDSEEKALRTYGKRMKVGPQKYTDGHYLTMRSKDGVYGLRFETDGGKIGRFYAGRFASVQLVEGCS